MKKNKSAKKTWIQNGVFVLILITLYATGLHTEVIGFAQRGVLATGLMNPDVKEITHKKNSKTISEYTKADLNIKLIDSNGKIISLSDLKDKVIFLNYWATWCPPCIAEMPSISKLHKEMGNDVAFILLSFDKDFETAKAFNKRKGYNLPIYTLASNLPTMLQSSALPTTYIIDREGNIVLTHEGMANYNTDEFRVFLESLK
ncbi:TlpA disulfide reductase family protein [Polaribacter sp. HaHaR_3_91]|uniref:TlpA family protein disulfide reductase n=1 Tax=Polaribacter sp. HaHaR_3_91 TaxID=2745561 RepID=UPI001C4E49EF|nr:TlpA disulfide reductase family protein [Polaribacter sp. HaHaR_3_91]QXP63459.1 TlpA family protein disulfide reductase [Polaribacter sp. HaHaR_3_91]